MSTIDFARDIQRLPDPKEDRAKIVMPGNLPRKTY